MEGLIQSFIDLIAQHEHWAGILLFLTAMTEAIAVIGFFVPGTTILVGVGAVAGLSHLPVIPLILWAAAGAVAGDGLSYWIGHRFKDRIRTVWPFRQRPEMLASGEAFFDKHGPMGVFIGRFVPALRAIVPMAAGLVGMAPLPFYTANILSALVWSPTHVLAGTAVGLALELLGAFAGRVAILLGGALVVAALLAWLIRIGFGWIAPAIFALQRRIVRKLRLHGGAMARGLARLIDPDDPGTPALLVLAIVVLGLLLAWISVTANTPLHHQLIAIDHNIATLMLALRNPVLDAIAAQVAAFGDASVLTVAAGAILVWLFFVPALRLALGLVIVLAVAVTMAAILGWPMPNSSADWLPSGQTLIAATLYGSLGWILFANGRRWLQWSGGVLTALVIIPTALARLYLGFDAVSDVVQGLLLGTVLAAIFGLVFRRTQFPSIHAAWLGGIAVVAMAVYGSWHVPQQAPAVLAAAAQPPAAVPLSVTSWTGKGWMELPPQRIELDGSADEPLSLQYAGTPKPLLDALHRAGWQDGVTANSASFAGYASPGTSLAELPSLVLTQQGHPPLATLVRPLDDRRRLVLRLWPTGRNLVDGTRTGPLLVGSLAEETLSRRLGLISTAHDVAADPAAVAALASALASDPALVVFGVQAGDRRVTLIHPAGP